MTTETDSVTATSDGSIRWNHNFRPVRVRKGADWIPVDTTLMETADGRIAPVAASADVSFSAGGDAPMVTIEEGAKEFALDSPLSPLPAPVLAGDTATYPDVLPGVDLQLKADVDGFSQLLVVRNASAARNPRLKELTFHGAGKGLRLASDNDGNLRTTDDRGAVVMTGGGPTMWDAAQNAVLTGRPQHGNGQMKRMRSGVTGDAITLTPDQGMLGSADTLFPVYIDPSLTLSRTAWSIVDTNTPTTAYWNSSQEAQIGTLNGGTTKRRSYFSFELAGTAVAGRNVTAATLQLTETYSGSCTARQFSLYSTGPVSSATTWNNQPALGALQSSATVAKGFSTSCPGGPVAMDATAAVRAAATAGGTATLGLRAASETDNTYFKRFSNNPTLTITYSPAYAVADSLTTDGKACVTGSSRPVVSTNAPTLATTFTSSAIPNANTSFEYQTLDGVTVGSQDVPGAAAGSTVTFVIPQNQLALGGTYRWRVRATDDPTSTAGWYGWCEFTVHASFTATFGQDDGTEAWAASPDAAPNGDQQQVTSIPGEVAVTSDGDNPPVTGVAADEDAETGVDTFTVADSGTPYTVAANPADPPAPGSVDASNAVSSDNSADYCASATGVAACRRPATADEIAAATAEADASASGQVSTSAYATTSTTDPTVLGAVVNSPDYTSTDGQVSAYSSVPTVKRPRSLCYGQPGVWYYTRFEGCLRVLSITIVFDPKGARSGTLAAWETRYVRLNKQRGTWDYHTYLSVSSIIGNVRGIGVTNGGVQCTSKLSPSGRAQRCSTNWTGTGGRLDRQGKIVQFDASVTAVGLDQNEVHQLYAVQFYSFYVVGGLVNPPRTSVQSMYVRCDQAMKGTAQEGCVVGEYLPKITYLTNGTAAQVAKHIKNSQVSKLPSILTRLFDDSRMRANGRTACPSTLTRPEGKQCDEYPFRSSRQGANLYASSDYRTFAGCQMGSKRVTGSAGFSRCFVSSTQNKTAGDALNRFYSSWNDGGYRIIDGESFEVATQ
ncbi:hypothetical protein ACTOB_003556 [Actinoplanes oblitus]|uniref:Carbohydrate-binding module family 96 domain-containing protein n=1 Tax=Actinoplanes oblitus TaxID=3040509 RepID=A0ABY8WS14_9ACTN|nr:hypothetical protein [Actinoplanes oblitus]WIM99888.1 hypothetical protein ACTOB_003556 [Actinoplanes oblitus]